MSDISSSQQGSDSDELLDIESPQTTPFAEMCEVLGRSMVPVVRINDAIDDPVNENDPCGERRVTEMTFLREFVAQSRPCIVRGLQDAWIAAKKWQKDEYLFQLAAQPSEQAQVTVALTPNGRADCVTDVTFLPNANDEVEAESERLFMSPAEVRVPLPEVHTMIQNAKVRSLLMAPLAVDLCASGRQRRFRQMSIDSVDPLVPIPYCQLQNNCLETEYHHLKSDITDSVARFGERIFGGPCDASNLWIGTSLSVTSMHQDWYENLYAVVRGKKIFTLIPPWEAPLLKKETVRSAAYVAKWTSDERYAFDKHVVLEKETIDWIGIDLEDSPEYDIMLRNPEILQAHACIAEVCAGEVLYLPAMWFHRVAQQEVPADDTCVVAVNYWFDMKMEGPLFSLVRYVTRKESATTAANEPR